MFDVLEKAGGLENISITDGGYTLLHWFCYKKENDESISLLEKLIEKGSDVNAVNWDERTPLMSAAKNDMINTCRLLLNKGADATKHDKNGNQAVDLSPPASECTKLLLPVSNTQKYKIQISPSIKLNRAVLLNKRGELSRRFTADSPNLKHYETDDQCVRSKDSEDELQSNASPRSYVYPMERKGSSDSISTRERIWEKLVQARQKRQATRALRKSRAYSTDTEVTSPS
jgi:hypothetical protein